MIESPSNLCKAAATLRGNSRVMKWEGEAREGEPGTSGAVKAGVPAEREIGMPGSMR